ncbi:MAG: undecaprenyldiphospho-muramoylpentapeptide beta-N-acetylglucosaminyltransferase [Peptoniphilus sp.]|uniref:undecaprenyldiphospho-muramoylpentapeptide beta-N-acetylglucosaminyltransferase n=1 Tax=Peptoniphilus sp. TaxID=1971214 RepID=UPI002A76142B|nr:undecaprenyldiphospho-muramoylpentapeptide beta-N-acetylglucosaminyltransferase [Peptoniphilus sp.]MDY2986212.1 undecaprenyldiphospho-muramoylpentapeptide beta-N-acetylglucosaminyltransferase [Peptoniphilus sp.]
MKYILSGGGTGGHIYPALAIAEEIKKRDSSSEILYVGKIAGLEEELAKKAGFDFKGIHIEGLPRKKVNIKTAITLFNLLRGLRDCEKIIKNFKPDIVIGTGGYVCAPVVMKAQQKGIKTVIQEQNAYPGKTNRFLARKASLLALSFKEAEKYMDNKNIIITGNPVREDFLLKTREQSRKELNLKFDEKLVLSFGGSGGQESTNDAMLEILKNELDFKLVHITGKPHYDEFVSKMTKNKKAEILNYSDEISKYILASDLIITSSSAMALAEISQVGRASILIPKAYTAGNHQYHNAMSYKDAGASLVILEDELTGDKLLNSINELLNNSQKREGMAENSKKLGNSGAVTKIVDEMIKLI